MLYGKSIVLGVTGSIAAYKACDLASSFVKLGANVDVVMTKNATEFVAPLTFETLTKNAVVLDTFERKEEFDVKHISLAKKADLFLIAPADANIIAKLANGIADDMLSTTLLATKAPVVVCPAMNTNMYEAPQTVDNIKKLTERGVLIFEPVVGNLACGDTGKGKLAPVEDILRYAVSVLTPSQDLHGKTVLITCGATREPIDKVRYISNNSSGKMGFALASECINRGAKVILVKGYTSAPVPNGIFKAVFVKTTAEMFAAVMDNLEQSDIVIKAAAPSDYKVKNYSDKKIKDSFLTLELEKNPDIAKAVGEKKGNRKLVVFSAETENLKDNAVSKLKSKNADLVVANDVTASGAGFDVDTNVVTLITEKDMTDYPVLPKSEVAKIIIDKVLTL